jgi:hypothetical protein
MSQQKHNKIQPLWFSLKFKPNSKAKQKKYHQEAKETL